MLIFDNLISYFLLKRVYVCVYDSVFQIFYKQFTGYFKKNNLNQVDLL